MWLHRFFTFEQSGLLIKSEARTGPKIKLMQVIDIYLTAYGGATVWFADNQALQGSLINTLKVAHHCHQLIST